MQCLRNRLAKLHKVLSFTEVSKHDSVQLHFDCTLLYFNLTCYEVYTHSRALRTLVLYLAYNFCHTIDVVHVIVSESPSQPSCCGSVCKFTNRMCGYNEHYSIQYYDDDSCGELQLLNM